MNYQTIIRETKYMQQPSVANATDGLFIPKLRKEDETICTIAGLVGGFVAAIFGGWDSALVTLVIFMGIDFFTGVVTAAMKKSKHTDSGGLSSKADWFGLAKKVCTLLLIAVAVRMDILLGMTYIRDAVCISFCLNELLSIVENTSLMGIPYPPVIKKTIDVLQTKVGRMEEETNPKNNGEEN